MKIGKGYFDEKTRVRGKHHNEHFDFVVANGQAVQLTQTWSFQIPNQLDLAEQIKAWAWTARDLRHYGGMAETLSREIEVPKDVDIRVVYVPPLADDPKETLNEALAAFSEIQAVPVEIDNAFSIGRQASQLVGITRE